MADQQHHCSDFAEDLQDYVLGVLPDTRMAAIAEHIEGCKTCREALAAKTDALQALDMLVEVDPPKGLAQTTTDRVGGRARKSTVPLHRLLELASAMCVIGILAAILLPALGKAREASSRSSCQNNLKQMGIIFKMYANESRGAVFPPMTPGTTAWAPDLRVLYPEFLTDLSVIVCASAPNREATLERLNEASASTPIDWDTINEVFRQNFAYTAWAITSSDQLQTAQGERMRMAKLTIPEPMQDATSEEGKNVPLVREGVERFMITDINNPAGSAQHQSSVPIMIDADWEHHKPSGANVLYMDGHVAWVKYGTWPVVDEVLNILNPPR